MYAIRSYYEAALAVGTTFAGIDIIEGPEAQADNENKKVEDRSTGQGSRILEVNGTPSGKGIFDAWGINPAESALPSQSAG